MSSTSDVPLAECTSFLLAQLNKPSIRLVCWIVEREVYYLSVHSTYTQNISSITLLFLVDTHPPRPLVANQPSLPPLHPHHPKHPISPCPYVNPLGRTSCFATVFAFFAGFASLPLNPSSESSGTCSSLRILALLSDLRLGGIVSSVAVCSRACRELGCPQASRAYTTV